MTCLGCERVNEENSPFRIAALRESVVYLHAHQHWTGWCVLWLKDHHEHLHAISSDRQARLWLDVAQVARAVLAVSGCRRINYENLGNVVSHVHWHVVPRFAPPGDADPASPVWVRPKAELEAGVSVAECDRLLSEIRAAISV